MTYRIRPHHALCLLFFRGEGYSSTFTDNMAKIQKSLIKGAEVKIVRGTDDICSVCPNNKNGKCEQDEKVRGYDERVASICGLDEYKNVANSNLQLIIKDRILDKNLLPQICADCKWFGICENSLYLLQTSCANAFHVP